MPNDPVQIPELFSRVFERTSVPDYVKRDYPLFVAFLRAYYEFLEQKKQPLDIAAHLRDYRSVDKTLGEFLEYFRYEFLNTFPPKILFDRRLLYRNIKKFYLNKGNEQSYRFLFRILFGEDIEFYYPKTDILRASDGKWSVQRSLKIIEDSNNLGDYLKFSQRLIKGETSGAEALCERVLKYEEGAFTVYEIFVENVRGDFQEGEEVYTVLDDGETIISGTIANVIIGVEITEGGGGYNVGDPFSIKDGSNGTTIATGTVSSISSGPISGLSITNSGIGYNGEIQEISLVRAVPLNFAGEMRILDWDSNGDLVEVWDGYINFDEWPFYYEDSEVVFDFGNLSLEAVVDPPLEISGTPDTIEVLDNSSFLGGGAFGVIKKVGNFGEILEIEMTSAGDNYQSPYAVINTTTGFNGQIAVSFVGGAVTTATLDNYPLYIEDATVDFSESGLGNATGEIIEGHFTQYPGRWLNTDGFLSSDKRLQDNYFYQDYSYVIRSPVSIEEWRELVRDIIHPAGMLFFGEVFNIANLDAAVTNSESLVRLYTKDSDGELIPVTDSDGNHVFGE